MDISKAFVDSWNVYVKHFFVIVLASIVASLLSILIAPVVGLQMMFVKAKRGGNVEFNELFSPFKRFFALFFGAIWIMILLLLVYLPAIIAFSLNWNVIGLVLVLAGIAADIYLGVSWMFAILMIYDQNLSIGAAMKASRELVVGNNFWLHLLLLVLAGIVSGLGNIIWGIGAFLTLPLGLGAIVCAYIEESKK